MSVADTTTDTTTFGIMTGADALSGGLISVIADVGAIAQQTGQTAVALNTASARANAPVTATPMVVNSATGQVSTGSALSAAFGSPMVLVLIVVLVVALASK